eukprot:230955-Chlamydomonas_euryale.AAC.3
MHMGMGVLTWHGCVGMHACMHAQSLTPQRHPGHRQLRPVFKHRQRQPIAVSRRHRVVQPQRAFRQAEEACDCRQVQPPLDQRELRRGDGDAVDGIAQLYARRRHGRRTDACTGTATPWPPPALPCGVRRWQRRRSTGVRFGNDDLTPRGQPGDDAGKACARSKPRRRTPDCAVGCAAREPQQMRTPDRAVEAAALIPFWDAALVSRPAEQPPTAFKAARPGLG